MMMFPEPGSKYDVFVNTINAVVKKVEGQMLGWVPKTIKKVLNSREKSSWDTPGQMAH